MDDLLKKRLLRRLERLPDEQVYRVLDYVEFLESKYGSGERKDTFMDKIADGVQDTMRATRLPAAAVRGTMSAVSSASKLMDKLAGAGRAAADELGKTLKSLDQAAQSPRQAPAADAEKTVEEDKPVEQEPPAT